MLLATLIRIFIIIFFIIILPPTFCGEATEKAKTGMEPICRQLLRYWSEVV